MVYFLAIIVLGILIGALIWCWPSSSRKASSSGLLTVSNHRFEIIVHRSEQTIRLRADEAAHRVCDAEAAEILAQAVDLTFPLAGFRITTVDEGADTAAVVFRSLHHPLAAQGTELATKSDEVAVQHLSAADLAAAAPQFSDLAKWVADAEKALEEHVAATARVRYQAKVKAEQMLAKLRPQGDFLVTYEAFDFDEDGQLSWAIQLGSRGRCWLYSDGKAYLGPLESCKAVVVDDALEVTVRDVVWESRHFDHCKWRVLTGSNTQNLLAWCDRINVLADLKPAAPVLSGLPHPKAG